MSRVDVRAFSVGGAIIVAIEAGENGPVAVTADGAYLPLDADALMAAVGDASLTSGGDRQLEDIAAAVEKLPLYWREQGGELTAITVGGGEVSQSADAVLGGIQQMNTVESPLDFLNAASSVSGSNGSTLGKLAGALGEGIAGQIGGALGSLIIDMIFPPKPMQSYFDELYERIAKLVKEEITQTEIDKINGTLDGTQAFIRNVYLPRKQAGAEKAELSSMLRPYMDALYQNVTYTLLQDRFRKPGFSVFLVGASTHLTLIQELALVDPNARSPRTSSYAESVKKQAKEYSKAAQQIWDDIKSERTALFEVKVNYITMPTTGQKIFARGWIVDHDSDETIWEATNMLAWAFAKNSNLKNAQAKAVNELSQGLAGDNGVDTLLDNWGAAYNALPEK